MEDPYVAAESAYSVEKKYPGGGAFGPSFTEIVPTGLCHAVRAGDERSACGIPVGQLVPNEDHRWGSGLGMDWCQQCSAIFAP